MSCKVLYSITGSSDCKIKLLFLDQRLIMLGRGNVLKKSVVVRFEKHSCYRKRRKLPFLSPHAVTFKIEYFQSIFWNPRTNKWHDYYCMHVRISFWLSRSWTIFTLILDHQSEKVKKQCTRKRNSFLKPKPALI